VKEFKRETNATELFGRNTMKAYICHVIFFIVLDLRLLEQSVAPFFMFMIN